MSQRYSEVTEYTESALAFMRFKIFELSLCNFVKTLVALCETAL